MLFLLLLLTHAQPAVAQELSGFARWSCKDISPVGSGVTSANLAGAIQLDGLSPMEGCAKIEEKMSIA